MKRLIITLLFYPLVFWTLHAQVDANRTGEVANDTLYNKFYITNLTINSMASDFGPSFHKDNTLLFSSAQKNKDDAGKKWKTTGQRYLNFYTGIIDSVGNVSEMKGLSKTANSIYHESNAVFSKKGDRVYFTRNNFYEGKKNVMRTDRGRIMKIALFIADVDPDGGFHNIVPFPYNSNEYSTGHPALSLDEKTLYFTSDMPGSIGKTDIFKVDINDNGTFSVPENLGGNVNTKGREMFPFVAFDGTLYFSSDYHDGYGKFDIFKTDSEELELAAIQNLGEPFNSSRDDFSFVIDPANNYGYFSSNRIGGVGDDDVYHFYNDYILRQRQNAVDSLKNIKEKDIPPPEVKVVVDVINARDKHILENAVVEIVDDETGDTLDEIKVDEKGSISFIAKPDKTYSVEAVKPLYKNKTVTIKTSDDPNQFIKKTIALTPETRVNSKNEVIVDIKPIYFDFDSSKITADAAEELNKVIEMMQKYPTMIIEGTSHTDARGSETYNKSLSERRANATVDYIVSVGKVNASLIFANGYGETKLTNRCANKVRCTEAEHSMNRRTEFIIVNVNEFK